MIEHNSIYLLLGSNINPRFEYLKKADKEISEGIGLIVRRSQIYESEALGFFADVLFLNQVLLVDSKYKASEVLEKISNIEYGLGRSRTASGYASRTIDIDILYFNDEIITTKDLIIPHPRLHERSFTLVPLNEIASDFINPQMKVTNKVLFDLCLDNSEVSIYKNGKINAL